MRYEVYRTGVKVIMSEENLVSEQPVAPAAVEAEQVVAPTEKMLSQSEVNALVGQARQKGREDGYQRGMAEVNAQASAPAQTEAQPANSGLTAEQVRQIAREERAQELAVERQKQQVNMFAHKVVAAESEFPGLTEKVNNLGLQNMPEIVEYANQFENTAAIMAELADNPEKMGVIVANHRTGNPGLAMQAMGKLAESIKLNQQAAQKQQDVQEPISQLKQSDAGRDSEGPLSVSDLRKLDYNRRRGL